MNTNSHLPNRRLLGDFWQNEVFTLNGTEEARFLSRHADIKAKVDAFLQAVKNYGYQQGVSRNYPIPEYGMAVADTEFGNVTIFPNASGQLIYTGNVPNDVAIEVNKPPYVSPVGDDDVLTKLLAAAPWIIGGMLALMLLNSFPGRRS